MASDDKTQIAGAGASKVEPGTRILGTFEIAQLIATGGMGEVYRGFNIHTNQSVAIKIVLAALAHDEKIISLFQKEATVLGELHHDAIVRYNIFTIDPVIQRACLVMEFVEGRSMADYIDEGPMSVPDARTLLHRLAGGLQKAHDLGVVHRDLSPDNVIIQDGMVSHAKIIDFGIAKSAQIGGGTLIGNQFAGKYNFVSPEQLGRFKGEVTNRSDIYSLGLVAVAGARGEALDMGDNPAEAVERRMNVPDLSGVPDDLRPLFEMMLQPDPADRPQSMTQVQQFLDQPHLIPVPGGAPEAAPPGYPPDAVSQPPQQYAFTNPQQQPQGSYAPGPEATGSPFSTTGPQQRPQTGPGSTLPPQAGSFPGSVATEAPKKKSRTGLILVLLLLAVGGGGAGAYFSGALDTVIGGETPDERQARLERERLIAEADARAAEQDLTAAFLSNQALSSTDLETVTRLTDDARLKLLQSLGISGDTTDLAGLQTAIKARVDQLTAEAEQLAIDTEAELVQALRGGGSFGDAERGTLSTLPEMARTKLFESLGLEADDDISDLEEVLRRRIDLEERLAKAEADKARTALFTTMGTAGALSAADLESVLSLAPESLAELLSQLGLDAGTSPDLESLDAAVKSTFLRQGGSLPGQGTDVTPPNVDVDPDKGETVTPTDGNTAPDLSGLGRRIEWVRDYPLASCTHAHVTSATDTTLQLEGFATSVDPFWKLLTDFNAEFGAEPEIGVRLVKPSQCAVVDFIKTNSSSSAPSIKLTLDKDVMEVGGTIRGSVEGIGDRSIWLFLVDNNGSGYNLTGRLRPRDDGTQGFGLRLRPTTLQPGALAPHMIIAVATDEPLSAAEPPPGVISALLMPIIQADINALETPPAVAIGYFRFDTDN